MLIRNILFAGLCCLTASLAGSDRVEIDEALGRFLGTLERYANTVNDVVFLLDESGSIGADKFPQVKLFAKLTAQRLVVSADYSRIAVVTFATETITHINYIKDPYGNNMCTLLKKIDDIGYAAEWTHTDKAMKAAEDILAQARPDSNKIIVLLTDGQSNDGHSPVVISNNLKQRGIIIFAIGVADVNVQEINAVATSPDHIYILKDFDYIIKVNKYLVNDTREISMDLAKDSSYCNALCTENQDCCDRHANCFCGTRTGRYECACHAGYHGKGGYKGQCHKCPKGTYKSESRNAECTACPAHSTTEKEGSTSFKDCVCETGYEKIGNMCAPIRCASLSAPDGGILIPTHCNNTYGTQCSFKCREGYCPFSCNEYKALQNVNPHPSLPSRTCLETREWSGQEFHCEKRTCPALRFPYNGNHNCSEKDFTFGTTCNFQCNKGYEISGSKTRTCLFNSWTGDEVTCTGIFCEPLKTNARLRFKVTACGTNPMPYRSTCQYHCSDGYVLMAKGNKTDGVFTCEDNKKWSKGYKDISCQDDQPPKIQCPKSMKVDGEPYKANAVVKWDFPKATDNVQLVSVKIVEPKNLQKSPFHKKDKPSYYFPIGKTKVVYEATDHSKLSTTCSFNVEVLDHEPPKVVFCPEDIEIYHNHHNAIPVTWEEPVFEDNSKKLKSVTSARKSGDEFAWGPAITVNYTAMDVANNTASCIFQVKVKHYPCPFYSPPANGVVTCDNWEDGKICSVFCHDGFQFAAGKDLQRTYYCKQVMKGGKHVGTWVLLKGGRQVKMPWPDCSRRQKPASLNVTVGLNFGVDSCSEESLKKFREKFYNMKEFKLDVFCPKDKGCHPDNVNITCSPASTRARRSLRAGSSDNTVFSDRSRRDVPKQMLTVSFNVQVFPNATDTDIPVKPALGPDDENEIDLSSSPIMKDLANTISLNVKDAYNITNIPEPEVNYDVIVMCSAGQVKTNSSCVNCPAGTYKDDVSDTCIDCPTATYQDAERQLSCKACPVGFTTHVVKAKSEKDCKGPCQPGTYSETTFEPCLACSLNTYQDKAARKECKKCPSGLYTWRVGSNSSSDCVAPCKAGTFSDTGYEPCNYCQIGSYQDKERQTTCTVCPNRTTTTITGAKHFEDCKEFDICAERKPCQYTSPCIQRDKDYECECPEGLMGRDCEINLNDCASSPCLNNGTCIDGIGNFTCECLEGWTGHQCQNNRDDCDPNPCLNAGKCLDKINAYECVCLPGFKGEMCETNIYECESNPCLNNGTCFDMENGYRCCCTEGFYGDNCENEFITDVCDTVNCQNGGTCIGFVLEEDKYTCLCHPGFVGHFCEINIDECQDHECENGGLCVDGIGNATCNCPQRFTGPRCEEVLMHEYTLTFPTPSTTNYVEVNNVRRLYAITVSFFMKTSFKDPNSRATPVSYSYKHQDHLEDNALTLLDTNNFVLYIHGQTIHTEFSANSDSSWHHYAITWEKNGGVWAFYVDGKSVSSGQNVGENKYMHPGTFVLGQEQDDVGSAFSALEAFAGDITEFNVWDYAMTPEEIKKISLSCGYIGNVIPWYIVSQYVSGEVEVSQDVDKCKDLGHCPENSCDCFYSSQAKDNTCKNNVNACDEGSCSNGQPCITGVEHSFCSCASGFEGRRCEYDIDECLDNNGGCEYICVNDQGTGSYHCECPSDMILSDDGKKCKDTGYCLNDGQTYVNGETWVKDCQNCICDRGIVQCEDMACNDTSCLPHQTLMTSPGECCAKCVAWAFCVISLNNSVMSFDFSKYEIQGGCNYTAVEECYGGRFKVEVQFTPNRTNLVIYQDCQKMTISSDGLVMIDDHYEDVPFNNELWNVEQANSSISVKTNADLVVDWDFTNEAVISIPSTHVSKMCGICSKLEEYHKYRSGKFNLSERWATGENECYIISEGYVEMDFNGGSSRNFPSSSVLLLYFLFALITFTGSKLLT